MNAIVVNFDNQAVEVNVSGGRGPIGMPSGPLGNGSVTAPTISNDGGEQEDIRDKIGAASAAELLEFTDSVAFPGGAGPTATVNATAGNLTGTYYYRVSYVSAGGETEVGVASAGVSPSAQRVNLSSIPVSADPRVTGRRIYRTAAGAADSVLGKLVTTINNNTATTYTDNTADGSLGANAPYFNSTGGSWLLNGATIASVASISTRFGNNANPNQGGYANSAFGANSLSLNTNGFRNTALGVDALQINTTGYEMTAVGVHALGANTTAIQSTAFGYGSLENANANYNAAFGTKSMSSTTSGANNSAFGTFSQQLVTTGGSNASHGYRGGYGITTGAGNSCFGANAGEAIGAGNFNAFFGFQSGYVATGSSNVGVGFFSFQALTTGGDNVGIGPNAGKSITTGSGNVFIGPSAGNNGGQKVDAFRSIAIGYATYCDKDDQIVIGHPEATETILRGVIRLPTFTVATLPAANTMGAGARAFVTDANAATFNTAVAAGGANKVPVFSDGAVWRIG